MNKEELYKKALSNVHRYSLLNEIFAIRDERFPKEQQDNMLCVNGYISLDTLNRYVRYIDELVEYQNIDAIENLKEKDKEIERLNNIIKRIKDHFIFLKINSNGGNKEFFEDIIEIIEAMEELKEGKDANRNI